MEPVFWLMRFGCTKRCLLFCGTERNGTPDSVKYLFCGTHRNGPKTASHPMQASLVVIVYVHMLYK